MAVTSNYVLDVAALISAALLTLKANWFDTLTVSSSYNTVLSVPEIKQEYFHNNRCPTIPSVVYITTTLSIVCICLIASHRAVNFP